MVIFVFPWFLFSKLGLLISNLFFFFFFCFSDSGWAVGPSGGVVEPDLVMGMRLGGSSDGHFSYGPFFPGVSREPFSNERHLFSDSQLHTCGPYLEMEEKFFSDNMAIMRENYFDADLLLGVGPVEDLAVGEVVIFEDLVPVLPADEILWQLAAVDDILNVEIVSLAPVNSDSENEEIMERMTLPVVVEAADELLDAGEATGSADIGVDNAPELAAAAGGDNVGEVVEGSDYVGETAEGRAEAPSDPGPSGGNVSMDDFLPRPRSGPVLFPAFPDAAGDEVILLYVGVLRYSDENFRFFFLVHCYLCNLCVYTYSIMFCFLVGCAGLVGIFLASRVTYIFLVLESLLCRVPGRYEYILGTLLVWLAGLYGFFVSLSLFRRVRYD